MEIMNTKNLNLLENQDEVGGTLACIIACGSLCILSGYAGTAIAAAAYLV